MGRDKQSTKKGPKHTSKSDNQKGTKMVNCNDLNAPDMSETECLWKTYSWIIWFLTSIAVLMVFVWVGIVLYQKWSVIKRRSKIAKKKLVEQMQGKEHIYWYESGEY